MDITSFKEMVRKYSIVRFLQLCRIYCLTKVKENRAMQCLLYSMLKKERSHSENITVDVLRMNVKMNEKDLLSILK